MRRDGEANWDGFGECRGKRMPLFTRYNGEKGSDMLSDLFSMKQI